MVYDCFTHINGNLLFSILLVLSFYFIQYYYGQKVLFQ